MGTEIIYYFQEHNFFRGLCFLCRHPLARRQAYRVPPGTTPNAPTRGLTHRACSEEVDVGLVDRVQVLGDKAVAQVGYLVGVVHNHKLVRSCKVGWIRL